MSEILMPPEQDRLNRAKYFDREVSATSGEMLIVGNLKDIVAGQEWNGSISIEDRIRSGELTEGHITYAFELAGESYVPAAESAPIRCSDERGDEDYDDNDFADYNKALGPQMLGAVPAIASTLWMYKLSTDKGHEGTIEDELPAAIDIAHAIGYGAGAHGDTILKMEGCGDAKTKPDQMNLVMNGGKSFAALVGAYTGTASSEADFSRVSGAVKDFATSSAHGLVVPQAEDMAKSIKNVNPSGYFVKAGPHQGVAVIKNNVPGTTLHINRLDARSKGKLNSFNIDAWLDKEIARAISSDKKMQALVENIRGIQTMATSVTLLDGSLRFAQRNPSA